MRAAELTIDDQGRVWAYDPLTDKRRCLFQATSTGLIYRFPSSIECSIGGRATIVSNVLVVVLEVKHDRQHGQAALVEEHKEAQAGGQAYEEEKEDSGEEPQKES
jgi:hypothetical protein